MNLYLILLSVFDFIVIITLFYNDMDHNRKRLSPTPDLHFNEQTRELLYAVFYTLLAKDGKFVNGFTPGRIDPQLNCLGSQKAFQSLLGACMEFLELHGDELKDSIDTLDMSDVKVYDTFHETIHLILEEINWGRIVSAVCTSKTMACRAIKEGRTSLVESLHAWLQIIFVERLQDWVTEHGGWVS